MASFRAVASLTALAAFTLNTVNAALIPMAFCATINTASMAVNESIYQSDGLCRDFCTASNNAFAIVKDKGCWCSDYTPAQGVQVSTDKCNAPCPGFPSDLCGGDGVWGYIQLQAKPSGVKGDSGGSQTTEISTTTQAPDPTTLVPTTTPPNPTPTTAASSSKTTKTNAPVSSNTNTATTPVVIISTVTNPGGTSQVTITLPPSSNGGSAAQNDVSTTGSGLTTGAAVGIAVGVLALVGIAAGLGAWFFIRRRNQNKEEAAVERSNSGRGSSAGMMSTPRTEMASIWDSEQLSTGRRNSRLMPHDPRMDPFAGNIYGQANKSRESVNTLQDNQDYSRKVLRTTNPDPDQD